MPQLPVAYRSATISLEFDAMSRQEIVGILGENILSIVIS
jgi:hypothetical protein